MTLETIQKKANLQVNGVADVQGNRGPQWEIQIQYPFSKYPTKQWIDNDGTHNRPVAGETYPCIIQRGELSKEEYDGAAEWMYRWRIVEFDTSGEPWAPPAGPQDYEDAKREAVPAARVPSPISDPRQHSIERQVVLKAAVEIYVGYGNEFLSTTNLLDATAIVRELASELWPVLQNIGQEPSGSQDSDVALDGDVDLMNPPSSPGVGQRRATTLGGVMPHPDLPRQAPVDPNAGEQPPTTDELRI